MSFQQPLDVGLKISAAALISTSPHYQWLKQRNSAISKYIQLNTIYMSYLLKLTSTTSTAAHSVPVLFAIPFLFPHYSFPGL